MATIEDFFDFVGTNDIPQNARIYVSDMSGQIHDIGDVLIEPPVIELNFAGRVTFISDSSRFSFNRLTPGAVYDAVVDGRIAMSRYESYVSLLGDCTESKYR